MRTAGPLDGLIKWVQRDEWRDDFAQVISEHLGELCEDAEIPIEELPDVIGEDAFASAWASAFEDFLTRELDDDGRNPADAYLKRRGWKESAGTRAYIQALRHSVPSLYEVSDVVRDDGFVVRDLVRGGEPFRIIERMGSRSLANGERIAGRVVVVRGQPQLTGMILRIELDTTEELLDLIQDLREQALQKAAAVVDEAVPAGRDELIEALAGHGIVLAGVAPVITQYWLADLIGMILDVDPPDLINAEGDQVIFLAARYPLAPGATPAAIEAALDAVPALRRNDPSLWNWLATGQWPAYGAATPAANDERKRIVTTLEDGSLVLGTVDTEDDGAVTIVVNSVNRLERGRALIEAALGDLVGEPEIEQQGFEGQMGMDDYVGGLPLPSDEERALVHKSLTDHYRRQIDSPIPFLDGRSPRALVRTAAGRDQVAAWLEMLERSTLAAPGPMANYDFGWLWNELGLADRRR